MSIYFIHLCDEMEAYKNEGVPNANPRTLIVDPCLTHCYTASGKCDVTVPILSISCKGHCRRGVGVWCEDGHVLSALGTWSWMRQRTRIELEAGLTLRDCA